MTVNDKSGYPPIRMIFELDQADDPVLYGDLMRCRKGQRRVNRLRLLAHEGAVSQFHLVNPEVVARILPVTPVAGENPVVTPGIEMELASDVFADPITEG
jgi:hypothetical protein